MKIYNKNEEVLFQAQLLGDITYFHRLYAKYKDPKWLEVVKVVNEIRENVKKRIAGL